MLARSLAALLLTIAIAAPAAAQPSPAPNRAPPSHDAAVEQLATILGRSHYLRMLCAGSGDQTWRTAMLRMLDLEAPSGPRRDALIQRFNDGFRMEEEAWPDCSAQTQTQARTLARDGKRLSDAIAAQSRSQ